MVSSRILESHRNGVGCPWPVTLGDPGECAVKCQPGRHIFRGCNACVECLRSAWVVLRNEFQAVSTNDRLRRVGYSKYLAAACPRVSVRDERDRYIVDAVRQRQSDGLL